MGLSCLAGVINKNIKHTFTKDVEITSVPPYYIVSKGKGRRSQFLKGKKNRQYKFFHCPEIKAKL